MCCLNLRCSAAFVKYVIFFFPPLQTWHLLHVVLLLTLNPLEVFTRESRKD